MNEPPPRQVRSDEETLGEIFNGSPYAVDADVDPHADWVPRAEQVFDEKKLMQLSIWKKYWDEDEKAYEAIDLAYKPYGPQQTREWSKLGYLDEKGHLRTERELIESGALALGGGAIGTIGALASLAALRSAVPRLPLHSPAELMVMTLAAVVIAGVIAGAAPAARAARTESLIQSNIHSGATLRPKRDG